MKLTNTQKFWVTFTGIYILAMTFYLLFIEYEIYVNDYFDEYYYYVYIAFIVPFTVASVMYFMF